DALLDHMLATYDVDPDRVYLTGLSLGAYGVWDWSVHRPHAFAAIAPIAGEGNDDWAGELKDVPVWAFHGGKDQAVSLAEEQRMRGSLPARLRWESRMCRNNFSSLASCRSINPAVDSFSIRIPIAEMYCATSTAPIGSAHVQPGRTHMISSATSTPALVTASVRRCFPSATSVTDPPVLPARIR